MSIDMADKHVTYKFSHTCDPKLLQPFFFKSKLTNSRKLQFRPWKKKHIQTHNCALLVAPTKQSLCRTSSSKTKFPLLTYTEQELKMCTTRNWFFWVGTYYLLVHAKKIIWVMLVLLVICTVPSIIFMILRHAKRKVQTIIDLYKFVINNHTKIIKTNHKVLVLMDPEPHRHLRWWTLPLLARVLPRLQTWH